ncbi:hypothetical protein EC991_007450 [Linnemannia zychae]|nr:hypothetical protein EC991_007450 [Linnemannia zychae]
MVAIGYWLTQIHSRMQSDRSTYGMQSFSKSTKRDRQMAIDGYFEPLNSKSDTEQRFQSKLKDFNLSSSQDLLGGVPIQIDTSRFQAVPTFTVPISELIREPCQPLDGDEVNGAFHIVPAIRACNTSVRLGKKTSSRQDPSKVYSGHIRMQSVLFVMSISQLFTTPGLLSRNHSSSGALVEIIGTLVAPLQYVGHCWEFNIRDPTYQDLSLRCTTMTLVSQGSLKPGTTLQRACKASTLHCRLYDFDNSLDQDALEKDEVVRLIGISMPSHGDKPFSSDSLFTLHCVSTRRATSDEIQLTVQGEYRGLRPKQA